MQTVTLFFLLFSTFWEKHFFFLAKSWVRRGCTVNIKLPLEVEQNNILLHPNKQEALVGSGGE